MGFFAVKEDLYGIGTKVLYSQERARGKLGRSKTGERLVLCGDRFRRGRRSLWSVVV